MTSIHNLHSLHDIFLGTLKNDSATSDAENCYLKKRGILEDNTNICGLLFNARENLE